MRYKPLSRPCQRPPGSTRSAHAYTSVYGSKDITCKECRQAFIRVSRRTAVLELGADAAITQGSEAIAHVVWLS